MMLTDNHILVDYHRPLPTLMCVQRRAEKKLVTDDDIVAANIASFGDDIGKTTNWITSMFEVQSKFDKDSEEYRALEYRIMSGQLYQQNSIDKAKGIVAQPMPRSWHDRHAANIIEDDETRRFYNRIVADKKPYFMIYIYPTLMKQYNTYIKNTDKNALREFQMTVGELEALPKEELTERQEEFLRYYQSRLPVGMGPCVMNRICRRFEQEFDGYLKRRRAEVDFDYTILKSDAEYTRAQYNAVASIREEYNRQLRSFAVYSAYERVSTDDAYLVVSGLRDRFMQDAALACPNEDALCNIVLDLCYTSGLTKRFAWDVCGPSIIKNLLANNGNRFTYPSRSDNGPISFKGFCYELSNYCVEEFNGDHSE